LAKWTPGICVERLDRSAANIEIGIHRTREHVPLGKQLYADDVREELHARMQPATTAELSRKTGIPVPTIRLFHDKRTAEAQLRLF
jgi:hypothetical protein